MLEVALSKKVRRIGQRSLHPNCELIALLMCLCRYSVVRTKSEVVVDYQRRKKNFNWSSSVPCLKKMFRYWGKFMPKF
ncbi:hypothetical protein DPMN_088345 [Dreissena polymorpha]|uniref:Uncharacterized protein n=1 Tax=Dreissena polymorpha TaxID=45954 RepID=A0A9D4KTX9_DREPO|nr:hypothetical protein DPMN_088345 [Dreissena polymorpha]